MCALLLVLLPLGQADISPFSKNLSQAASTTPSPCPKGLWPPLLANPIITPAFFLFHIIGWVFPLP